MVCLSVAKLVWMWEALMEILVRPRVVPLFFQMTLCSMRTWDTCPWHVGGGLLTHHTSSGCRKASSDCPCFLSVKNCVKKHSNLSFLGQKKWFFFWGGVQPTPPHRTSFDALPPPYWNPKYASGWTLSESQNMHISNPTHIVICRNWELKPDCLWQFCTLTIMPPGQANQYGVFNCNLLLGFGLHRF